MSVPERRRRTCDVFALALRYQRQLCQVRRFLPPNPAHIRHRPRKHHVVEIPSRRRAASAVCSPPTLHSHSLAPAPTRRHCPVLSSTSPRSLPEPAESRLAQQVGCRCWHRPGECIPLPSGIALGMRGRWRPAHSTGMPYTLARLLPGWCFLLAHRPRQCLIYTGLARIVEAARLYRVPGRPVLSPHFPSSHRTPDEMHVLT